MKMEGRRNKRNRYIFLIGILRRREDENVFWPALTHWHLPTELHHCNLAQSNSQERSFLAAGKRHNWLIDQRGGPGPIQCTGLTAPRNCLQRYKVSVEHPLHFFRPLDFREWSFHTWHLFFWLKLGMCETVKKLPWSLCFANSCIKKNKTKQRLLLGKDNIQGLSCFKTDLDHICNLLSQKK